MRDICVCARKTVCGPIVTMDYLKNIRNLTGSALDDLARALYERDLKTFEETVVGLVKFGDMRDYETAAAMLATAPMLARSANSDYTDARFGTLVFDQYFNMFLRACADCEYGENEYMAVLLSAQYGKAGGALNCWDKSVDRYLTALARADFDRAAGYVEKFDRKFGKYSVLIAVDRDRALDRLLHMALYGKKLDKAAVRDVLMDYGEVSGALISRYGKAQAHERVAIVRLLLMFKNDMRVRAFLDGTVAFDKSKSVRDAAFGARRNTVDRADASVRLERMMEEGVGLTVAQWAELLSDEAYAAVADRIFFCLPSDGEHVRVIVYNDGAFLDSADKPVTVSVEQKIYVLHPLDVTQDDTGILSLEISQPFLQISRPIYHACADDGFYSARLAGTMIARDVFMKNLKSCGFAFCDKRADDEPNVAVCRSGKYAVGVECDLPDSSYTVSCGRIAFYNAADLVNVKRKRYISTANALDMRAVPRRAYSELIYRAYKLFGNA